jgi:hypothetical protein
LTTLGKYFNIRMNDPRSDTPFFATVPLTLDCP